MKILVVEDESGIRLVIKRVLGMKGHEFVGAATAEEALALLEAHPDIKKVLSDNDLQKNNEGLKLLKEIRRRRPDLDLYFMTGMSDEIKEAEAMSPEIGAKACISKPFTLTELLQKLEI